MRATPDERGRELAQLPVSTRTTSDAFWGQRRRLKATCTQKGNFMNSMRADDDVTVTFTPQGQEAMDDLAEAMAATYDGSPESLERIMRCLNTADVDDLATDLSVVANDLLPVDEVARRRLNAEQARDIAEAGPTDRQLPSYGW